MKKAGLVEIPVIIHRNNQVGHFRGSSAAGFKLDDISGGDEVLFCHIV